MSADERTRPVWLTEADLATPLDSAFREIMRDRYRAAPDVDRLATNIRDVLLITLHYDARCEEVTDAVLRVLGYRPDGEGLTRGAA